MNIMVVLAVISVIGVPAYLAYFIALYSYRKSVKAGNVHARRNRIIIFSMSFILLLAAVIFLMTYHSSTTEFDR